MLACACCFFLSDTCDLCVWGFLEHIQQQASQRKTQAPQRKTPASQRKTQAAQRKTQDHTLRKLIDMSSEGLSSPAITVLL